MMPTPSQREGMYRGRRHRMAALVVAAAAALVLAPGTAQAQPERKPEFTPGAPGIGDPYFPLDGNGGYDVRHYMLDVAYDPDTDVLTGKATISARATQNLSSFNLDFDGLTVRSITVDGRSADWLRDGDELTVTPRRGIPEGARFTTVVKYDGSAGDSAGRLGLLPHRRRRARHRPAPRRRHLVPGQRPPDRQGVLHDLDHCARGAGGRLQRGARRSNAPPTG